MRSTFLILLLAGSTTYAATWPDRLPGTRRPTPPDATRLLRERGSLTATQAPGDGFAMQGDVPIFRRGSQVIKYPIRIINRQTYNLPYKLRDPRALPGWSERSFQVLNVLGNRGLLVTTYGTVFKIENYPFQCVDNDRIHDWFFETDRTYSYTATSGTTKTVRVLDYGKIPDAGNASSAAR